MNFALPDFSSPLIQAYYAIFYGMVFLAVLFGAPRWDRNWPERIGAIGFAVGPVAQSLIYGSFGLAYFEHVDWALIAADLIALIAIGFVAFNANRYWPFVASALLVFSLTAHIFRVSLEGWLGWSYAILNIVPTLLALTAVFVGATVNRSRRRRGFNDYDWVDYEFNEAVRSPATNP
ncbi:MAG: hypothetical protein AAFR88_12005 [Pseudomonadota bacterium]